MVNTWYIQFVVYNSIQTSLCFRKGSSFIIIYTEIPFKRPFLPGHSSMLHQGREIILSIINNIRIFTSLIFTKSQQKRSSGKRNYCKIITM